MWFLSALKASWDWLRDLIVAIWRSIRRRPIVTVLAASAVAVVGLGIYMFSPEISDFANRARPGQIIVNSPTVYTRQRLVNDRQNQTSWLREQLKLADRVTADKIATEPFRMIDQVQTRVTQGRTSIGSGASKSAEPPPTSQTKEDPAASKELF